MIERTLSQVSSTTFRRFALFFLSALFVAFGQPDRFFLFPLVAYSLGYSGIIVYLLGCCTKRERFYKAFLWGSLVELFQLNWLATTEYHGIGIVFVYLLVSFGIACQFGLLFLTLPIKKEMRIWHPFLLASLWTIIEWSRLYYLCGFPFNSVGLVLAFSAPSIQLAALFGVYGLSFWVILVGGFGALAWRERSKKIAICWALFLLSPFLFGALHIEVQKKRKMSLPTIDVALIQTGLKCEEKWEFPGRKTTAISLEEQWKRVFEALEKKGMKTLDLIVLPEVAFPKEAYTPHVSYLFAITELLHKTERIPPLSSPFAEKNDEGDWFVSNAWIAQALANQYESEVILGLLDEDENLDLSYNSAFHFIPFQQSPVKYDKRVLVPLAEYLPLPILQSFMEKFGIFAFFSHGKEAKVFPGKIPIAASICYEEGFNHLMREGREKGGQMFVNLSNDAWFPRSRLPIEHFYLGKLRAVENGVFVLRSCNTGITAIVNSYGETVASLREFDEQGNWVAGILLEKLVCNSHETLFSKFGNLLILGISIVISSLCIALNSKFG